MIARLHLETIMWVYEYLVARLDIFVFKASPFVKVWFISRLSFGEMFSCTFDRLLSPCDELVTTVFLGSLISLFCYLYGEI